MVIKYGSNCTVEIPIILPRPIKSSVHDTTLAMLLGKIQINIAIPEFHAATHATPSKNLIQKTQNYVAE